MQKRSHKILIVGFGKMGKAIFDGLAKIGSDCTIIHTKDLSVEYNVPFFTKVSDIHNQHFDYVIFCVKPQIIGNIILDYKGLAASGSKFISVIAGKEVSYFKKELGTDLIIRTMPNLPSSIGKGVTAIYADNLPENILKEVQDLLSPLGKTYILNKENDMHFITAISGSGPAYLYLLAETMVKAAMKFGFDYEFASSVVRQTIFGSSCLYQQTEEKPEALRQNVTSPNGTTYAALSVLMQDNLFEKLMLDAMIAASNRSKDLAGEQK